MWHYWAEEWAAAEKVSFNGVTKRIRVNAGVTTLDVAGDLYSAWVRWTERERQYLPAMRYSGYDPIPGGRTGATFFLRNGWKLEVNPNAVAVTGVLYSEDYGTAFWSEDDLPIYPATVSSLVNSAVSYQNVVTGTAASPAEIWAHATRTLTSSLDPTVETIVAQVLAALQATAIPANMVQVKGQIIGGSGSEADPWGPQ